MMMMMMMMIITARRPPKTTSRLIAEGTSVVHIFVNFLSVMQMA